MSAGSRSTYIQRFTSKGNRIKNRDVHEAIKKLVKMEYSKKYPEAVEKFKTKSLRDSYNDALLRADIKQEIKDVMMGHGRKGSRKHYYVSAQTIKLRR